MAPAPVAPVAPRGWGRGTARPRADVARREKESARDRVRYSSRGRVAGRGRGRLPGMRPSAPGGEGAGRRRSRRGSGSMQLGGCGRANPNPGTGKDSIFFAAAAPEGRIRLARCRII